MENRPSPVAIMASLALIAGCQPQVADRSRDLVGEDWPLEATSERMLVWVASTHALVTCQVLPQRLRMLKRLGEGDLDLLLIHVGREESTQVATNLLERERLSADYRRMSEEDFASTTGGSGVPAFYVVQDRVVVYGQRYASEGEVDVEGLAAAIWADG